MLNRFDDELVIAGYVEYGATSSWIGQLDQWLIAQRILDRAETQRNKQRLKFKLVSHLKSDNLTHSL